MRCIIALFATVTPALADHSFPVQRCVNLDQALEAPNEGDWGYMISQADIDWIAAQGFDTIRLPVQFTAHWDQRIEPAFLDRVDEVIGWGIAADLHVILDLHHFDALMDNPSANAPVFAAIWAELSAHYAGYDDRLMFELLNEPSENLSTQKAVALFERAIPVIRADHPNRWIILEGGFWSNITALPELPRPDPHVVRSFHYYGPFEFTHQQASWMSEPMPPENWGTIDDRELVQRHIAEAASYGTPLLLGEFGVTVETDPAQRQDWIKFVRQSAEEHSIGWCHWGFGGNFPLFDLQTRDWTPGLEDALMSAP